jgi:hypothetical protein
MLPARAVGKTAELGQSIAFGLTFHLFGGMPPATAADFIANWFKGLVEREGLEPLTPAF